MAFKFKWKKIFQKLEKPFAFRFDHGLGSNLMNSKGD